MEGERERPLLDLLRDLRPSSPEREPHGSVEREERSSGGGWSRKLPLLLLVVVVVVEVDSGGGLSTPAPCSAMESWEEGTCHVARCRRH
jgi:hypothetical protein